MRRLTSSLLLTSILLFDCAESYAAAPSAGEKCIKAGQSQIANGKKFTCIKSGKKLVWNRGALIKAVPTPKPSPVPSVTSSPTPAPVPQPTSSPIPIIEDNTLADFQRISKESYRLVRANWPDKLKNIQIEYHYTKNFPVGFIGPWKEQVESSAAYFEKFIDSPQIFHIYFVTELDKDWMEREGLWNSENMPTFFDWWSKGFDTDNCEGAAAWYLEGRNQKPPALYGGIAISSKSIRGYMNPWCEHVISHEMFHAVQDYWFHLKLGAIGFKNSDEYDYFEMPIFREGSADTFGTALGQPTYESYFAAFKDRFAKLLKGDVTILSSIKDKKELVEYLRKVEFRSAMSEAHNASYFLGMMLFEYAIATYGMDKYTKLLEAQNRNTQFRVIFKNVYGFEIDRLYEESVQHILNAMKILSN